MLINKHLTKIALAAGNPNGKSVIERHFEAIRSLHLASVVGIYGIEARKERARAANALTRCKSGAGA